VYKVTNSRESFNAAMMAALLLLLEQVRTILIQEVTPYLSEQKGLEP